MNRDPFYQQIVDRLNKHLDPDLFEQCACDLLRKVYPGLVPIRGGHDAGMDGAIAGRQEPSSFLVCTTSPRVKDNLKQSLKSHVKSGGTRREVVLATSQKLTAPQRLGLEKEATKLGFTLRQIHDQANFADRLYSSPEWCLVTSRLSLSIPLLSEE